MGFIRGGLLVIVSVLLFISILAGSIFLTLSWSLEYENVKEEMSSVILDFADTDFNLTQAIEQDFPRMQIYCQNDSEFVFNQEGYTFVIPCSVVEQGPEVVVEEGIKGFIDEIYYKKYECDFWNCITEDSDPFFLLSAKAKDYWMSKFYLVFFVIIVLGVLVFLLVEGKTNFPILLGILSIVAALLAVKMNWLFSLFGENAYRLFFIFFNQSYAVFLRFLIIGIVILVFGIVLKFFKVGFKISEFFSKKQEGVSKQEVKEIVKKEVSKPKQVAVKKNLVKDKKK